MTVSASTSRADYTGNGVTTAFSVPFYFLDNAHLVVYRTQISTGAVTTLALTTDYTVSGAGVGAGGTVTCLVAPTADQKISILRNVPVDQQTHYVANDPFPAASHEQALDKLTMIVQQQAEAIARAVLLSATTTGVSGSLPSPVALNYLRWNAGANALEGVALAAMGALTLPVSIANGGTGAATAAAALAALGAAASGANTDITSLSGKTVGNLVDKTAAQSFSAGQRGSVTTANTASYDMNLANNFSTTLAAGQTLAFTNITAGQSGNIYFSNGSNYAVAKNSYIKCSSTMLTTISVTGTYLLTYYSPDGTNVYVTNSGALS